MLPEGQELTELLAKKEQEWKELQQRQILFLQKSLKEVQTNFQEQKEKFERLKKDFIHNLKVLAERDGELQECKVMFARLKVVENVKQSEISDLRVQITKLQQELQRERKNLSDLQSHHQQRIIEQQIELEKLNSSKNSTIDRLMEEYENVKRQLERKLEEVQGDLNLQRQELSLEFDCEMKKREHAHRVCIDEMNTLVLSNELKVKLLTNELEVMREMALKGAECLQKAESANERMQELLRQKDFELKDLLAVKEARINELDAKVQTLQNQLKRQERTFQQKHEQLDRCAREKESALKLMKESHNEQVQELEKQKKEVQMCVETLQMEQERTQCNQQAELAEKDSTIAKLQNDVKTLKTGWDSYITQVSHDTVNKDLCIQSLQEKEEKLNVQIAKLQKDIERYQQQLSGSVERERLFEQARVQVELDWQKRCEGIEKTQYQKSEELIEGLSKAKDQMEAEVKEKDRRLNELQLVLSTVTWERDKAVTTVRKQRVLTDTGEQLVGTLPQPQACELGKWFLCQEVFPVLCCRWGMLAVDLLASMFNKKMDRYECILVILIALDWSRLMWFSVLTQAGMPEFASREIQTLQEQNSELRQVIGQMRKEMEMLCEQMSPAAPERTNPPSGDTHGTSASADYVKSLEEEIKDLKQRYRELEEQLELAQSQKYSPDLPSTSKPVLPDNAYIQTHIGSLNETIGALRADKVASAAAAKRLEARTAHLESMVAELTRKVQQKQAEINQLQFQLNNETRHSQATISSLQLRQSELELQLSEARKEAEEYFKGNLKQNLETVGLGNEVCALKLELASQRVPVVLSESEAVRQLREEVLALHQQLASLTSSGDGPTNPAILKRKLKEAVKRFSRLNMEKQQLIEKGNRLQAELAEGSSFGDVQIVLKPLLGAAILNRMALASATAPEDPSMYAPNAASTSRHVVTGKPKPQSRLSELERLQYQLTSQELQFAQYQKPPSVSANGHFNARAKPQLHGDSSAMQTTEAKPTQKENLSPSPRVHHVSSARSLHSAASLTDVDTSLQEVWKVLDMGSSLSLLSSQEETEQGETPDTVLVSSDSLRTCIRVLGLLVSTFEAIPFAQLHSRPLQRNILTAWDKSTLSLGCPVQIQLNNAIVVAYINHQGGTRCVSAAMEVHLILDWEVLHVPVISAVHRSRKLTCALSQQTKSGSGRTVSSSGSVSTSLSALGGNRCGPSSFSTQQKDGQICVQNEGSNGRCIGCLSSPVDQCTLMYAFPSLTLLPRLLRGNTKEFQSILSHQIGLERWGMPQYIYSSFFVVDQVLLVIVVSAPLFGQLLAKFIAKTLDTHGAIRGHHYEHHHYLKKWSPLLYEGEDRISVHIKQALELQQHDVVTAVGLVSVGRDSTLPGTAQSGNHKKVSPIPTPQSAIRKRPEKTNRSVNTKSTKNPKIRNYNIRD
ncbi:PREDICTED: coiled-coil domain-containing protein 57 [Nanorana parkeri]|uniref:coiled-coil domain-containing protein 57 n=1 Tax=Nanorana parkeri TaxID=125878 RepID=UPI000854BF30|nr:PREDICTED: coiled-coil domain-containing protein 57 [Nanorana parkeri]